MRSAEQGMEDRLRAIENTVAEILARLERLEDRIESRTARETTAPAPLVGAVAVSSDSKPVSPNGALFARLLQLVGRTFLVLGLAFLIRALSDGKVLSTDVGIVLALAVAIVCLGLSYRAGRLENKLSAAFHALTAGLIAYPLAYEASTRLRAISISSAAAVVAGVTLLLFIVAWRHRLVTLAWLGVAFCLLTTLGLMQAAGLSTELMFVLLLVAVATLWLAESCSWNGPRWPSVLLLDAVVLRSVLSPAHNRGADRSALLIGIIASMTVMLLTLASVTHRTFASKKPVTAFYVIQTFAGLSIGVVATLYASAAYGWNTSPAGVVILTFSAAAMMVSILIVPKQNLGSRDYFFYLATSAGLLFVGGALATGGELRGLLWGAIGLLAAGLGHRLRRVSLSAYGAAFIWAGAASSSLFNVVSYGFFRSAPLVKMPNVEGIILLAPALITYFVIATTPSKLAMRVSVTRFPASATLFLCAISFAALIVDGARVILGVRGSNPAFVAMGRSLALVAMATSLAAAHRTVRWPELAWIAYLILGLGGIKLLVEDLPKGRALTLLIAFAAYGIGLIVTQKLLRPLQKISYQTGRQLSTSRRT